MLRVSRAVKRDRIGTRRGISRLELLGPLPGAVRHLHRSLHILLLDDAVAPAMWVQFRMQAGRQSSVRWFRRGQTFDVDYSTVTYLQPSRSWLPVQGVICYR